MSSDKYNGWTNYETFVVSLWLGNEEGSHNYSCEMAQETLDEAEGDKDEASQNLARQLEEMHDEMQPEVSGVFSDLLTAALGAVDWHEIADSYLDECEYEADEEEAEAV